MIKVYNPNPLKNVSKNLKRNIENVLPKVGDVLVSTSRPRAPFRTGLLQSSINYNLDGLELIFDIGAKGVQCFYGIFQEEGTIYIKPKRFLASTIEDTDDEVQRLIEEAVDKSFK